MTPRGGVAGPPQGERAPAASTVGVSVVIPARNAADTISAQLAALSEQQYQGSWEVIVVDNGSRDRTAAIARRWMGRLPRLRIISASEVVGPAYARNAGCRASAGSLLLFCDADDIVSDGWLAALAEGLRDFPAVGGRLDRVTLNCSRCRAWRPSRTGGLPNHFGFLPFAQGANCGVRKEVWASLRGFDEELRHSEDVDFFWRVQLSGGELGYLDRALVHYRYRTRIRSMLRQSFGYGVSHAQLYKRFRSLGMAPEGKTGDPADVPEMRETPLEARLEARLGRLARRLGWVAGIAGYRLRRVRSEGAFAVGGIWKPINRRSGVEASGRRLPRQARHRCASAARQGPSRTKTALPAAWRGDVCVDLSARSSRWAPDLDEYSSGHADQSSDHAGIRDA
ncbi:MAG: glycosyltransferase [Actinomycetota bacterium]|nr:glycosyltransferase [Actinomycetota bacterium]